MRQRTDKGFSIIGIIAAIAIPNLLASAGASNEGSAQQSLRTISRANPRWERFKR